MVRNKLKMCILSYYQSSIVSEATLDSSIIAEAVPDSSIVVGAAH
jgi:hypothetical protein